MVGGGGSIGRRVEGGGLRSVRAGGCWQLHVMYKVNESTVLSLEATADINYTYMGHFLEAELLYESVCPQVGK